jgi:hypothetical protein
MLLPRVLDRVVDTLIHRASQHVSQRGLSTLEATHGLQGAALTTALVERAIRDSGRIGAAGGAVASIQWAAPVTFVAIPAEIAAEAVATAMVEIRLIADLHTVHGRQLPADPRERAVALVQAWADQRGVRTGEPASFHRALSGSGRRRVRHRLMLRLMRNMGSFAPLLSGAVIGASLNRRETKALAIALRQDLAATPARV